jgi:competence protein ComEA
MLIQKIKDFCFDYFYFNKQERNGVLVLVVILFFIALIRLLLPSFYNRNNEISVIAFEAKLPISKEQSKTRSFQINSKTSNINKPLFVFDPNTMSEEEALMLGFKAQTIKTLIKYRAKGGKFQKPEDLKKVYGVSTYLFNQLEPYILIAKKENYQIKIDSTLIAPKSKQTLELNSADSLGLVYLKGIGPGFTKRILNYRKRLGGFHSLIQLKEVYGMTDSLFQLVSEQVLLNKGTIKKIYINSIDFNTLRMHPYFSYQTSNLIINYRFKHGAFTEESFKNLDVFNEDKLKLILPYLEF